MTHPDDGFVQIGQRLYKTVAKRIDEFRSNPQYAGWVIDTEVEDTDTEWLGRVSTLSDILGTAEYLKQESREASLRWLMAHWGSDRKNIRIICRIRDQDGKVRAIGHAEENRARGQVNKTSALENCETSAIGRALANLGLGGAEFASANEVENAIYQQQGGSVPVGQSRGKGERFYREPDRDPDPNTYTNVSPSQDEGDHQVSDDPFADTHAAGNTADAIPQESQGSDGKDSGGQDAPGTAASERHDQGGAQSGGTAKDTNAQDAVDAGEAAPPVVMPFGTHKDKPLTELPDDYLQARLKDHGTRWDKQREHLALVDDMRAESARRERVAAEAKSNGEKERLF